MEMFISWSGTRSKHIARALWGWLPELIMILKPWMSNEDILAGAWWGTEIREHLKISEFGIICVTPENLREPWILFEAGALANRMGKSFVCPYLFELQPSDIEGPLAQFQCEGADQDGTLDLVRSINSRLRALGRESREERSVASQFEKWWPDLKKNLEETPGFSASPESCARPRGC